MCNALGAARDGTETAAAVARARVQEDGDTPLLGKLWFTFAHAETCNHSSGNRWHSINGAKDAVAARPKIIATTRERLGLIVDTAAPESIAG